MAFPSSYLMFAQPALFGRHGYSLGRCPASFEFDSTAFGLLATCWQPSPEPARPGLSRNSGSGVGSMGAAHAGRAAKTAADARTARATFSWVRNGAPVRG